MNLEVLLHPRPIVKNTEHNIILLKLFFLMSSGQGGHPSSSLTSSQRHKKDTIIQAGFPRSCSAAIFTRGTLWLCVIDPLCSYICDNIGEIHQECSIQNYRSNMHGVSEIEVERQWVRTFGYLIVHTTRSLYIFREMGNDPLFRSKQSSRSRFR